MWRLFECLARGALVLEEGHEGPYNPNYRHTPVAHFDLKPSNSEYFTILIYETQSSLYRLTVSRVVLIASKDDDHPAMGVFKVR